ncbi:sensor histidine kinase [bacterium]|nr:sensor histidine kinase [bacterium]
MKICESAQWLERQMDALANYARFCSRRVELGTVELSPLMRGVSLQQLEKSGWPEDCVEFVGAFPTARADRAVLKIVFAELFENALRFCAPGQRPQISVRAEVCEGRVEITIRDRGIGIPEHCLPLLGNPFQKFHPGPGVGLGLTLVRRALAAIQGRLLCSSVAGQGSTFQVSLEAG